MQEGMAVSIQPTDVREVMLLSFIPIPGRPYLKPGSGEIYKGIDIKITAEEMSKFTIKEGPKNGRKKVEYLGYES